MTSAYLLALSKSGRFKEIILICFLAACQMRRLIQLFSHLHAPFGHKPNLMPYTKMGVFFLVDM